MKLHPYQEAAAAMLRTEILKGGEMTASAPIGSGRSMIIAEACRDLGPVAFISRSRVLRDQFAHIAASIGVENVTTAEPHADVSGFYAVIVGETHPGRTIDVTHSRIIRESWSI